MFDRSSSPRMLEVAHVAHRLSVSDGFVRLLLRRHELPGIRLPGGRWRVAPEDLEAFIAAQRVAAQEPSCRVHTLQSKGA